MLKWSYCQMAKLKVPPVQNVPCSVLIPVSRCWRLPEVFTNGPDHHPPPSHDVSADNSD